MKIVPNLRICMGTSIVWDEENNRKALDYVVVGPYGSWVRMDFEGKKWEYRTVRDEVRAEDPRI